MKKNILTFFKKSTLYLLLISIAILNSFSIKKTTNEANIRLSASVHGSAYLTIYKNTSNTITSIVVQDYSGSHTYNNPSFPLNLMPNGGVTVIVHFNHTGVDGYIALYKLTSSGWELEDSESYDPRYLSPIYYETSGPENWQLIIY